VASRRPAPSEPEKIRVVPTNPDPVASLGVWAIHVTIGERSWRIPPLDAAEWLKILLAEDLSLEAIFPGLAGPAVVSEINMLMLEGLISDEDLIDAIKDAIEAVSGRRWWITLRLARTLRNFWERVGGELAAHGVTPFGVSLSYWLDGAYAICFRLIAETEPKRLTEFTQMLVSPPPDEARKIDDVAEGNAFLAAMRQAGSM